MEFEDTQAEVVKHSNVLQFAAKQNKEHPKVIPDLKHEPEVDPKISPLDQLFQALMFYRDFGWDSGKQAHAALMRFAIPMNPPIAFTPKSDEPKGRA